MKRWADLVVHTILSPEFLVLLLALGIWWWEPLWLQGLGTKNSPSAAALQFLGWLPVGLFVWCASIGHKILFPADDERGDFQRWPKFPALKDRVIIGLSYQLLFAISSSAAWLLPDIFKAEERILLLSFGIAGGLLGAITFYLAGIASREIILRGRV